MESAAQDYERIIKLGLPCLYYPLTENKDNVEVKDHSGYEHNGRIIGEVVNCEGRVGATAINFKGNPTYLWFIRSIHISSFSFLLKARGTYHVSNP